MKTKMIFILSTALTVFILLLVGGVMLTVTAGKAQANSPVSTATSAAPVIAPALSQALLQREAAYQAALTEANARLQKANDNQRQLEEQIRSQQAASASPATQPVPAAVQAQAGSSGAVSLDQAAQIARNAVGPNAEVLSTRIVYLDGNPTNEINFPEGSVYVDANGKIVLTQPVQQSAPQSVPNDESHKEEGD